MRLSYSCEAIVKLCVATFGFDTKALNETSRILTDGDGMCYTGLAYTAALLGGERRYDNG